MQINLEGKVALVFGAGSSGPGWGNGKAAAVSYARAGARVVVVDLNLSAAEKTSGIIAAEHGEALALAADVAKESDVAGAVARAIDLWGRIDILHNNPRVGGSSPSSATIGHQNFNDLSGVAKAVPVLGQMGHFHPFPPISTGYR